MLQTGRAFAAVTARGILLASEDQRHLELVPGSLSEALSTTGDAQPAGSAAMLDEANRMRAEIGLPALIGDAKIAQAAHSHSAYWTMNDPTNQGLDIHYETRGKPGFTGHSPKDRCASVGIDCGAEVAYEGKAGAEAVQGWIATTTPPEDI